MCRVPQTVWSRFCQIVPAGVHCRTQVPFQPDIGGVAQRLSFDDAPRGYWVTCRATMHSLHGEFLISFASHDHSLTVVVGCPSRFTRRTSLPFCWNIQNGASSSFLESTQTRTSSWLAVHFNLLVCEPSGFLEFYATPHCPCLWIKRRGQQATQLACNSRMVSAVDFP